ncbi:MAG: hypothetical protein ACT4NV_10515 [Rhodoferax sp.]
MRKWAFFAAVSALWGAAAMAQPQRPPAPQRAQLEHVQRMQLRSVVREQRAQHPPAPAAEQDEALPPRHLSTQERRALRQQLREQRDQGVLLPPPGEQ